MGECPLQTSWGGSSALTVLPWAAVVGSHRGSYQLPPSSARPLASCSLQIPQDWQDLLPPRAWGHLHVGAEVPGVWSSCPGPGRSLCPRNMSSVGSGWVWALLCPFVDQSLRAKGAAPCRTGPPVGKRAEAKAFLLQLEKDERSLAGGCWSHARHWLRPVPPCRGHRQARAEAVPECPQLHSLRPSSWLLPSSCCPFPASS